MKIHFFIVSLFTILILIIFSCQKSELEFSCNPRINNYVKKNLLVFQQITLSELSGYSVPIQRAIFNSWDYQKKRNIWLEKLQYFLDNENYTFLEKSHIQKLIDHIDEDFYLESEIDSNSQFRSQFAEEWIDFASNTIKWSDKYIAFVVYRLYTNFSQLNAEPSNLELIKSRVISDSELESCDCNSSSDYCGTENCFSGGCEVSDGCGFIWSMSCDGSCY